MRTGGTSYRRNSTDTFCRDCQERCALDCWTCWETNVGAARIDGAVVNDGTVRGVGEASTVGEAGVSGAAGEAKWR